MNINLWSEKEVQRAESTWGNKTPQYTLDMFDFLTKNSKSWLDLGCGFGRFLNYLINLRPEEDINYIGYDSSVDMVKRMRERFPIYAHRIFEHNITMPIVNNTQEAILCSAVLIHIPLADQTKVMTSIFNSKVKRTSFDINCQTDKELNNKEAIERFIKGSENAFRMTWQSKAKTTKKVDDIFKGYHIESRDYDLKNNRFKTVYFLTRGGK